MCVFGVVLLIGLAVLMLIIFPSLIDLDKYKAYLLTQLEAQLDHQIEVADVTLSVFPSVQVRLEQIALLDDDRVTRLFSADHLALDMSVLSLLGGELVVTRFELDRPRVTLQTEHAKHIDLADFFASGGKRLIPAFRVLGFSSSLREVAIRDGQIGMTLPPRSGDVVGLQFQQVNMTLITPDDDRPAEFTIGGVLPQNGKPSKVHVAGTFSTSPSSKQSNAPSLEYLVEGSIDFSSLNLAQIRPYVTSKQYVLSGSVNLKSQFVMSLTPTDSHLTFEAVEVQADIGSLTGSVAFHQSQDEPSTFQAKFSTSQFETETALDMLLPGIEHTDLHATLTRTQLVGKARIVRADVSSDVALATLPEMTVSAAIDLEGMGGQFGEENTPFRDINASLLLEDDVMELRTLSGHYHGAQVLSGIGVITALYDQPDIESIVTFMVPTSEFLDYFRGKEPSTEGSENLWAYETPTGEGVLTLEMSGSLNPYDVQFEGQFQSRGMAFHSLGLGLPVSNLFGQLNFSPTGLKLSHVKARTGRSRVTAEAHFRGEHSTISLNARADTKELVNVLFSKTGLPPVSADTLIRGITVLDLIVEGTANQTDISSKFDLQKTGFHSQSGTKKPSGVPATADVRLLVHKGEEKSVDIKELRFSLEPLLLSLSGQVVLTTPPQFSVSVTSNLVRLEEFHARAPHVTIHGVHPEAGLFEADLTIKRGGQKPNVIGLDGEVSLIHGQMSIPEMDEGESLLLEDVNAALQFSEEEDGRVEIGQLSATMKRSRLHVKGEVTGLNVFPRVRISIDAPQFDFESIIPDDKPSPIRQFFTSLSRTTILQSDIHIDTGLYKDVLWNDMHLAATGMDGVVTLEVLQAKSGRGEVEAHTTIHLPKDEPAHMDGHAKFTAVPAQDLVTLLKGDERLVFGDADLRGDLAGNGGGEQGISPTLNGRFELTISDGRIRKFSTLSTIVNLLNLPQLLSGHIPDISSEGLAFDSITATLEIENGHMNIEKLSLNSPIMKIGGIGTYDIPHDHVDMVLAVSPLGSYDLSQIPVLNLILAGGDERRGILTALFEVKGPLNKSEVSIMPGESVASGLTGLGELAFDILKNTLLLPKELIAPSD